MSTRGARSRSAAAKLRPLVDALLPDGLPITVRFWDGSTLGPDAASAIVVRSPRALRRLLWAPGELGFSRAYVAGELDVDGDLFDALSVVMQRPVAPEGLSLRLGVDGWARAVIAAMATGAVGPPPAPPSEEARLRGRRHSKARDEAAIAHHYDISNDFYRLLLGATMTYSCAYFGTPGASLDDAQEAKYDLICRKLSLQPGMRLLDVGCGWGGMVVHAASRYGVQAVGVTVSERQADLARKRIANAGLSDRVEIRLQDYRQIADGPYDAVSSIGMFEHVGLSHLHEYFGRLYDLVRPEGRLLNHGISRPRGSGGVSSRSFIGRYVFPDGELHEVGAVVSAMQEQGFEVRDVESLREHYARTLRCWVANLRAGWDDAVGYVGLGRARVWELYMAASALNFEAGRTSIHQVLAVKATSGGASGMPASREELLAGAVGGMGRDVRRASRSTEGYVVDDVV